MWWGVGVGGGRGGWKGGVGWVFGGKSSPHPEFSGDLVGLDVRDMF